MNDRRLTLLCTWTWGAGTVRFGSVRRHRLIWNLLVAESVVFARRSRLDSFYHP